MELFKCYFNKTTNKYIIPLYFCKDLFISVVYENESGNARGADIVNNITLDLEIKNDATQSFKYYTIETIFDETFYKNYKVWSI